jgi:small subunit ribosomal protein S1
MDHMVELVPGSVPPDEGYWQALMRQGEFGKAAPAFVQVGKWEGRGFEVPHKSTSVEPAPVEDPWDKARAAMDQGEVLELPVVGCNRGGVLVAWNGLRGFVPASHLVDLPSSADEAKRRSDLRHLVGSQLCLRIIELDKEQGRFVLSERASRLDEGRRQELLDELCPGDIRRGRVNNLCSFGAFVDLGGLEGLVHVSELSWGRVDHPSSVLEPGQSVEVYVLNVDRERDRVGLSIKRLQPDPWQSVEERYYVGEIVEGVITNVVNFGAFARVEDGLEGLIHVSELADGNFVHPRDVVQEGDIVRARVLNIDSERRRMGLSMRRVKAPIV